MTASSAHHAAYSTVGFMDRDIEAALDAIAAAGFRAVEILGQSPHVAEPLDGAALIAFHRRLLERGFMQCTVHGPMGRHVLGAPDEDWRRDVSVILARYIRFAGELKASGIVIHPVPNRIFVPKADDPAVPAQMGSAARRSLDDLIPIAAEVGVRILLENLPYREPYPFVAMSELRSLVDGYPADQVGLVIDTGHSWTRGNDPAHDIRIAGGRLWNTHLQDVDLAAPNDQHWIPGHGGLDWTAIRDALRDVGYAGPWTFEVGQGRSAESPVTLAQLTHQIALGWRS
jgi:sugar phosphate isomerase/epimerase